MAKLLRTFYVDVELVERLKKLSDKTRVPQSVFYRQALEELLNREERKIKKEAK